MPHPLYDKFWNAHLVRGIGTREALLYVDLHLIHEITSPQAFEGSPIEYLPMGVFTKDVALAVIAKIGAPGRGGLAALIFSPIC